MSQLGNYQNIFPKKKSEGTVSVSRRILKAEYSSLEAVGSLQLGENKRPDCQQLSALGLGGAANLISAVAQTSSAHLT